MSSRMDRAMLASVTVERRVVRLMGLNDRNVARTNKLCNTKFEAEASCVHVLRAPSAPLACGGH